MPLWVKLLAVAALVLGVEAAMAEETATITATGRGSAQAAPDVAVLGLGVETRAQSAGAAVRENSAAIAEVIREIEEAGVPSEAIRTEGFRVAPLYGRRDDRGIPEPEGFAVSNSLQVRITDVSGLGALLDRVIEMGANRIDQLQFQVADPAPLEAEARARAVADARAAAQAMAEAAGLALGRIVTISEGRSAQPMPVGRVAQMEAAAVPIAEGALEISAQVTVVWELAQP